MRIKGARFQFVLRIFENCALATWQGLRGKLHVDQVEKLTPKKFKMCHSRTTSLKIFSNMVFFSPVKNMKIELPPLLRDSM